MLIRSSRNELIRPRTGLLTRRDVGLGLASTILTKPAMAERTRMRQLLGAAAPCSPNLTAPVQAQAQGYTNSVINADFSTNNTALVSTDISGATVAPLYTWNQFDGTQITGYTIANGELVITQPGTQGFGEGISTACSQSPSVSSPPVNGGTLGTNTGTGMAFRYGYFEGLLGWDYSTGKNRTFWLNYLVNSGLEIDIVETFPGTWTATPVSAIHEWVNKIGGDSPDLGAGGTSFGGSNSNLSVNNAGGVISYNTFGLLWTPTFMQIYFNNIGGAQVNTNQTFGWYPFTAQPGPPYDGTGTINGYGTAAAGYLYLQMGIWPLTGPLHIKTVRVWQ